MQPSLFGRQSRNAICATSLCLMCVSRPALKLAAGKMQTHIGARSSSCGNRTESGHLCTTSGRSAYNQAPCRRFSRASALCLAQGLLTGSAPEIVSKHALNSLSVWDREGVYLSGASTGSKAHPSRSIVCSAYAYPPGAARAQPWQSVAAACALAMLLLNFHRSTFTMLVPLMANELHMGLAAVGGLQSAMLLGYLAGQMPAGALSDERGGARVLLAGLALWSVATAATPLAAKAPSSMQFGVAAASRFAMGLASACAMPAVASMAARWVPAARKAGILGMVYAFFNIGGVLGFAAAPMLAEKYGWSKAFVAAAAGGLLWSAVGSTILNKAEIAAGVTGKSVAGASGVSPAQPLLNAPTAGTHSSTDTVGDSNVGSSQSSGIGMLRVPVSTALQLAALCWAHAVIGWGFFVLQSWIPLYMQSLGVASLGSAGLLAALPWLLAAVVGAAAGGWADGLIQAGRPKLQVRYFMHGLSTLGCAVALAPLVISPALPPLAATGCLAAATSCYACCFGGFHAYIQDIVRPGDTGRVTGLTNTCSILAGLMGNLATGILAQATGSYQMVFGVGITLYVSSWFVFVHTLQGARISL